MLPDDATCVPFVAGRTGIVHRCWPATMTYRHQGSRARRIVGLHRKLKVHHGGLVRANHANGFSAIAKKVYLGGGLLGFGRLRDDPFIVSESQG